MLIAYAKLACWLWPLISCCDAYTTRKALDADPEVGEGNSFALVLMRWFPFSWEAIIVSGALVLGWHEFSNPDMSFVVAVGILLYTAFWLGVVTNNYVLGVSSGWVRKG